MDHWRGGRGRLQKIFFELVPNLKSETIKQVFEKYIHSGSIIVTDGCPSYPCAVTQFGSVHDVVNHSLGFVTALGANTNQIENMWSHLKQDYRGRHGLNHNRIHLFLKEFSWKKKNIVHSNADSHKKGFYYLLEKFQMSN